ncbi:MAG: hypothetical protein ACJA0X_000396 [Cyclobacteriaceae bacterium]|jgi:hypothetical protein
MPVFKCLSGNSLEFSHNNIFDNSYSAFASTTFINKQVSLIMNHNLLAFSKSFFKLDQLH